jgi:RHS repeat-associated protein
MLGRTVTATDALSNAVHTAYTPDDVIAAQWGATYPVAYTYDTQYLRTSMRTFRSIDGANCPQSASGGDLTQWLYDSATSLCTNKVYADNSRVGYTFTPSGQPLRTIWARDAWNENTYDLFGQFIGTAYSDATPAVTLSVNRLGTVSDTADASGLVHTYAVDDLQIVTNETVSLDGRVFNIKQSRDVFERPETITVRLTNAVYASKTRSFDSLNRLASLAFTNSHGRVCTAVYAYDGEHETNWVIALPGGNAFTRSLTRDPRRPALVTRHGYVFNGNPFLWYACNRDILGRVTNAVDSFSVLRDYLYNTRSEVTGANIGTNTAAYLFDDIGNRISATENMKTTEYTANALNQYSQISAPPAPLRYPLYDADGNMLSDGKFSYTWDAKNRLTSATPLNPILNSKRLLFRYDWRHRLTTLTTQSFNGTAWTPHSTRTFIYDGWLLSLELVDNADGTHQTFEYFWGNDLSGSEQGAGGVGGLLAVSVDGVYHLPCYDHNGNITAYASENGTLSAQFLYDAFGNILDRSGPLADIFRFRFSTKYFIPETRAYYYGHRFYSVALGRWLSRDVFGEQGGLNLYLFTLNEPLNAFDWLGNCTLEIHIGENKPKDAPSDAGGWFEGVLPSFGSKNKNCPAGQVGTKFTVGECSAKVWLKSDIPEYRNHELSHVKCLDTLESQLSSIAIELGCVCPSPCYDAHVSWIAAMANHASAAFAVCIASRDCHDNGNGEASSWWCVDFANKEQALKAALKAVQEASRRMSDACSNN